MATKRSVGTLKEADLKGKRVFLRSDLNVPLDDNFNITDDTRIRAAVPTIKYLTGYGAKVILSSHLVCFVYNHFHDFKVHVCVLIWSRYDLESGFVVWFGLVWSRND